MEAILALLSANPGVWAFVLLVACGIGMPPWSEELVVLGTGYFVAQGDLEYLWACIWCISGILAGDSVLWGLGRFAGERVYGWPVIRRAARPARRKRFNRFFLKYGTRAVFLARFLPGVRLWTYLVAGNLRMPWWKFALLDLIGALIMVPVSVFLGFKFAENLDYLLSLWHHFQTPILVVVGLGVAWFLVRARSRRRLRLLRLLEERRARDAAEGANSSESPDETP